VKEEMKCTICGGVLAWQGNRALKHHEEDSRAFKVCWKHLPIDGLPRDWELKAPGVPTSNLYRAEEVE
jgi:hypothetical protein